MGNKMPPRQNTFTYLWSTQEILSAENIVAKEHAGYLFELNCWTDGALLDHNEPRQVGVSVQWASIVPLVVYYIYSSFCKTYRQNAGWSAEYWRIEENAN